MPSVPGSRAAAAAVPAPPAGTQPLAGNWCPPVPLLDSVLSMTNLCYERGEWRTHDDIVSAADWRGRAWPQVLREDFGYELKTGIGSYHGTPLALSVYQRDDAPRFLIEIEWGASESSTGVYASDLADVMDLLRQWVPIIQGAITVADLVRQLAPASPGS